MANFREKRLELILFQVNADGVKYYNYTDPATGQKINAAPGLWYDEVLRGKHVYLFGNDFDTFCWVGFLSFFFE